MIEILLQAEGALSVGLLDRAEALYRQVASADPRNAIAVVGLSRVALERGRQEEALELARQALAIDRENVAAQRLTQRLEEVLAFRGGAVARADAPGQVGGPPPEQDPPPEPTPAPSRPQPARRSLLDRLLGRR